MSGGKDMTKDSTVAWKAMLVFLMSISWFFLFDKIPVQGAIQDPDSFDGLAWEYLNEASVVRKGWIQSMCVTDQYIVCFENRSSKNEKPDTIVAFYKGNMDEKGKEVPPFSYAKHVTERDYEHGNGMTYNPNTNEIYIVTGPVLDESNRGNVYVVDAETLLYKRTIQAGGGVHNFWGIDYAKDTNQYILQSDGSEGYLFYIADENFQIVDQISDVSQDPNTSVQDFCVSGDYILSMRYDKETELDNFMHVYSVSKKSFVGKYRVTPTREEKRVEIESICELSPGVILLSSAITSPRRIRFFRGVVPAVFKVATEAAGGTITESTFHAEGGKDYTVTFQPDKNHELTELAIDGEVVESRPDQTSYTFSKVQADHSIQAVFGKIPKYSISTSVRNGAITESKKIYRGNRCKVAYTPEPNYEVDRILIDGKDIPVTGYEQGYVFEDVKQAHSIEVRYAEIPSWSIMTKVRNGTISKSLRKVYRDTSQMISYQPDEEYILFSIKVDGAYVDKKKYRNEYVFSNVQKNYMIEVLYIWRYLPVIMGICGVMILLGGYAIFLHFRRKRWKKKKVG